MHKKQYIHRIQSIEYNPINKMDIPQCIENYAQNTMKNTSHRRHCIETYAFNTMLEYNKYKSFNSIRRTYFKEKVNILHE